MYTHECSHVIMNAKFYRESSNIELRKYGIIIYTYSYVHSYNLL